MCRILGHGGRWPEMRGKLSSILSMRITCSALRSSSPLSSRVGDDACCELEGLPPPHPWPSHPSSLRAPYVSRSNRSPIALPLFPTVEMRLSSSSHPQLSGSVPLSQARLRIIRLSRVVIEAHWRGSVPDNALSQRYSPASEGFQGGLISRMASHARRSSEGWAHLPDAH